MTTPDLWLDEIKLRFRTDKQIAEKAIVQLSEEELHRRLAPSTNSVAVIIRHVAGNLRSRWTDFLTTDGEKGDRDRESEFTDWTGTREELMQSWERGFAVLFETLDSLKPEDLHRTVTIRAEPHSVPRAIIRSLDHLAYHVGQVLLVARRVHAGDWKYITIAPGGSAEFSRHRMMGNS